MATYSLGAVTVNVTAGTCAWEIRTAATDRALLYEIGWALGIGATGAGPDGIGRPAAIGVTPTSPLTFQAENPADPASTVTAATAWGTGPTAPTSFLRRFKPRSGLQVATFPRGLLIPVSGSIVLWNISGAIAADVWAYVDE